MKLRQTLAVGAATFLFSSALGAVTVPAQGAPTPPGTTTLKVNAPRAVGINAAPIDFVTEIQNLEGDEHADARLFFTLELDKLFGPDARLRPAAIQLEYRDGEVWKPIALAEKNQKLTGSPDRKFLTRKRDEKLRLRLSVDERRGGPAVGSATGSAQAKKLVKRALARQTPAAAANPCRDRQPGFRLVAELNDVNPQGKPVNPPVAKDAARIQLGDVSTRLNGVFSEFQAGAKGWPFTLSLCNPTDSTYPNAAAYLFIGRPENADLPRLRVADVVLELRKSEGGPWEPVPLLDADGGGVIAQFVDANGSGVPLKPDERLNHRLRLGFKAGTPAGPGTVLAVAALPETSQLGQQASADFRIVAPKPAPRPTPPAPDPTQPPPASPPPASPPPGGGGTGPGESEPPSQSRPSGDLADTGAANAAKLGLVGLVLVAAGLVAVLLTRRRRQG
jgi:LPXTG-motif cell wall-anchored protein